MLVATPTFDLSQRNKVIDTEIRFTDALNASPLNPESVKISINQGKPMNVPNAHGLYNLSFSLPPNDKRRVMLLNLVYKDRPYQKFIRIPFPPDDFDVAFYPEGGQTLLDCMGRLAFKAMQQDGTAIDVSGVLYDSKGKEINRFKTDFKGIGQLTFTPVQGEAYHAVCTNNSTGKSKRFDLPEAQKAGYALTATWLRDNLMVKIIQPEAQKSADTLYLVIHTRGMVQDILTIDNTSKMIALPKGSFLSGISNLLLLTKDMLPLSERLIFVNNVDHARIACTTDRDAYSARSPVEYTVSITDEIGKPLSGSFSVSVTDDQAVTVDTTSNILTSLLLSSDLRGYIPNPAFYIQNNALSNYALDLLMLTQGWRRYDTEKIMRSDFQYPDSLYATGYEITGTVQRRQAIRTVPVANAVVDVMSLESDYFGSTVTDSHGRFYLYDGGLTDSIRLLVRTAADTNTQNLVLMLDSVLFPARTVPVTAFAEREDEHFHTYAEMTEQQYVNEHGARMIQLDEVVVTAKSHPVRSESSYYTFPDITVTESDIQRYKIPNWRIFFQYFPITQSCPDGCVYLLDDFPVNFVHISSLSIDDIERVEFVTTKTVIATLQACCAVAVYTKKGIIPAPPKKTNIANIIPLGFQRPVAFYAPKYDIPRPDTKPDQRPTIHWQPNLTTGEEGKATLRFYTADALSTYSIVIEGVTDDGKIIYKKEKISVITDKLEER